MVILAWRVDLWPQKGREKKNVGLPSESSKKQVANSPSEYCRKEKVDVPSVPMNQQIFETPTDRVEAVYYEAGESNELYVDRCKEVETVSWEAQPDWREKGNVGQSYNALCQDINQDGTIISAHGRRTSWASRSCKALHPAHINGYLTHYLCSLPGRPEAQEFKRRKCTRCFE